MLFGNTGSSVTIYTSDNNDIRCSIDFHDIHKLGSIIKYVGQTEKFLTDLSEVLNHQLEPKEKLELGKFLNQYNNTIDTKNNPVVRPLSVFKNERH